MYLPIAPFIIAANPHVTEEILNTLKEVDPVLTNYYLAANSNPKILTIQRIEEICRSWSLVSVSNGKKASWNREITGYFAINNLIYNQSCKQSIGLISHLLSLEELKQVIIIWEVLKTTIPIQICARIIQLSLSSPSGVDVCNEFVWHRKVSDDIQYLLVRHYREDKYFLDSLMWNQQLGTKCLKFIIDECLFNSPTGIDTKVALNLTETETNAWCNHLTPELSKRIWDVIGDQVSYIGPTNEWNDQELIAGELWDNPETDPAVFQSLCNIMKSYAPWI